MPERRSYRGTQEFGSGDPQRDIQGEMRSLVDGVTATMDEDGFRQWLDVRTRFRQYSFNNSLLILAQNPAATMVASYTDWHRKFNRYVLKRPPEVPDGKWGMKIWRPVYVKVTDTDTGEETRK